METCQEDQKMNENSLFTHSTTIKKSQMVETQLQPQGPYSTSKTDLICNV